MSQQDIKQIVAQEYIKCAKDPAYFMRKYCYIQHPKRGRILFNLYPFQESVLHLFRDENYIITLKSRQLGISTLAAGYSLWSLFVDGWQDKVCSVKDYRLLIIVRDKIVDSVINKYYERSKVGYAKYKTNLERNDLNTFDWLNHLQDELMDATLYVEKLKEQIQQSWDDLHFKLSEQGYYDKDNIQD